MVPAMRRCARQRCVCVCACVCLCLCACVKWAANTELFTFFIFDFLAPFHLAAKTRKLLTSKRELCFHFGEAGRRVGGRNNVQNVSENVCVCFCL